jgi:hypothetical protein
VDGTEPAAFWAAVAVTVGVAVVVLEPLVVVVPAAADPAGAVVDDDDVDEGALTPWTEH